MQKRLIKNCRNLKALKQEVNDDLGVCILNTLPEVNTMPRYIVSLLITQNIENTPSALKIVSQ